MGVCRPSRSSREMCWFSCRCRARGLKSSLPGQRSVTCSLLEAPASDQMDSAIHLGSNTDGKPVRDNIPTGENAAKQEDAGDRQPERVQCRRVVELEELDGCGENYRE